MPPFTQRQYRNPEDMPSIEAANLNGAARLSAREAIIIAEGDALGTESVDAVGDEQRAS